MSDTTPWSAAEERRRNPELRALIDEMLERVREMHRHTSMWEPDERARAEAALEQIMARVRRQAARSDVAHPDDELDEEEP